MPFELCYHYHGIDNTATAFWCHFFWFVRWKPFLCCDPLASRVMIWSKGNPGNVSCFHSCLWLCWLKLLLRETQICILWWRVWTFRNCLLPFVLKKKEEKNMTQKKKEKNLTNKWKCIKFWCLILSYSTFNSQYCTMCSHP